MKALTFRSYQAVARPHLLYCCHFFFLVKSIKVQVQMSADFPYTELDTYLYWPTQMVQVDS